MAPLSWMTLLYPFLHDHMPSYPGWLHTTLSWMTSHNPILDDHIPPCLEWPHATLSWMTTIHPILDDQTPSCPIWLDSWLWLLTLTILLVLPIGWSSSIVFLNVCFQESSLNPLTSFFPWTILSTPMASTTTFMPQTLKPVAELPNSVLRSWLSDLSCPFGLFF